MESEVQSSEDNSEKQVILVPSFLDFCCMQLDGIDKNEDRDNDGDDTILGISCQRKPGHSQETSSRL